MEYFIYKSEEDFKKAHKGIRTDKCDLCGGCCELDECDVYVGIDDIRLTFPENLVLKCKVCGKPYMPQRFSHVVYYWYRQALERGATNGIFPRKEYEHRYEYCNEQGFRYDYRDHLNMPGLCMDEEHSDGFLTPVYFYKKALIFFCADPEYEVNIFSETYGDIGKKNESGNYEWMIPFGFNCNDKLVFWLGDLATVDSVTLGILKSFNVDSDHKLLDSEFYQAQLNCVFSEPILEKQIFINKRRFISNTLKTQNIELEHLSEECKRYEEKSIRPVSFSEAAVSEAVNALHKVLVEGISVSGLFKYYETLYLPDSRPERYKEWKSIRLIQEIVKMQCQEIKDIYTLMTPLYLLNDYRNLADHLLDNEKIESTKRHIIECLDVEDFSQQEEIYIKMIKGLNRLYQVLSVM